MTSSLKQKIWKWTKEAVIEDARKYQSKSAWRKNSRAYAMATRRGWLEEATAHMTVLWKQKWTKEAVLEDALKYTSRREWETKSNGAVSSARRNGWYEEATNHMSMLIKRWTKESVIADAQKYKTRGEWFSQSKSYSIARKNNWVEESTAHMISTYSFGELVIYTYLLEHNIEFMHQKKFDDLRHINKLPFDFFLPTFNLLVEYNGIQHERGWQGNVKNAKEIKMRDKIKIDYAVINNFNILIIDAISKDEITTNLAEKIKSIDKSFAPIKRKLTLGELKKLKSLGTITKEHVIASAKQFDTIRDWREQDEGSYNKSLKMGWLDEATSHMKRLIVKSNHWTKEKVLESAKQFKTQTAWKKEFGGAWAKAVRNNWMQDACAHMDFKDESITKKQGHWTKERVIESALKFTTQAEWRSNEPSALAVAIKKGWLAEATMHMTASRPNQRALGYWTKQRVLEDAKQYISKSEWMKNSRGAYSKAYRNGWLDMIKFKQDN
jgi:hypothetical protein